MEGMEWLSGEECLDVGEGDGIGEGVVADLLAAEGREEGAAVEGHAKVAGDAADIGAFSASDAEIYLRQFGRDFAKRGLVEVRGERRLR